MGGAAGQISLRRSDTVSVNENLPQKIMSADRSDEEMTECETNLLSVEMCP